MIVAGRCASFRSTTAGCGATFLVVILIVLAGHCGACRPNLEDYDVCFNIFLERDYPMVEVFLLRPPSRRGVVLVGPGDIEVMCSGFTELLECYAYHYLNCYSGSQGNYIERLLKAMVSSFHTLCGPDKSTLQALLFNAQCLERVNIQSPSCHAPDFDLAMAWKNIFRFQATKRVCSALSYHKDCLLEALSRERCLPSAATVFNSSVTEFLSIFCNSSASSVQGQLTYCAVIFGLVVLCLNVFCRKI